MNKIIYHGSKNRISIPQFGVGKKYNDYGLGFYCTEDISLAKEWSVGSDTNGYANRFSICENELKILELDSPSFTCLHWLELLLRNRTFDLNSALAREAADYLHRNFAVDISKADVIIGYRADDSYFTYAQEFLNGTISFQQLSEALRLGKLGKQYVLKSKKAFEAIKDDGYELAGFQEWYPKKQLRDDTARRHYREMNRRGYIRTDLYMVQILQEEVKADDTRLR